MDRCQHFKANGCFFFKRNICNSEILYAIMSKSFQGFQTDVLHESKINMGQIMNGHEHE